MPLVDTETTDTSTCAINISHASGNNRYLVALLTENHWAPANHASSATIDSVAGTVITTSGGGGDGLRVRGWYWLDDDLPAASGTEDVTINGNAGSGRQFSVLYFNDMKQEAPADINFSTLDYRGDTSAVVEELTADADSVAIMATIWIWNSGNTVSLGSGQTAIYNTNQNNGLHTHSYNDTALTLLHDFSAYELNGTIAFAIEPAAGGGGGGESSTPNNSLGGVISITEVVDATLQNLFDNVSLGEATAGDTEYRCVYVLNDHATLTAYNAIIYIHSNTPNTYSTIDIGLGTSAINGEEQTVANESTAPTGVTFSSAANEASALSLGNIPAGQHKAVWFRRTITADSPSYANDNAVIRIKCDTVQ